MMFTVEEMNLIRAMDHTNRRMTIADIKKSIPTIKDRELKDLCAKTLAKVAEMSDEEFSAIGFTAYEEDESNDGLAQ